MRRAFGLGLLALALAFLALAFRAPGGATAQDVPDDVFSWRTDLDAAREEARESGRPLLVVFR